MKCPIDDALLVVTERSGVEIDYCPQCRGVWLDRGELDKVIDRTTDTRAPEYPAPPSRDSHHGRSDSQPNRGDSRHDRGGKRRREGFLGDLFDF
ncbi:TFIIB-type zinc ribbon-containing protein [Microbacterium lacticum]|uniref:TFIIB-type zinc ribbon-containing protein n=1 Tax=Microbacterium lacticum TaxID=33885 RepID=UPI001F5A1B52|nr:zf-TFIIB domain-containing protein [Microbacterium lacticum]